MENSSSLSTDDVTNDVSTTSVSLLQSGDQTNLVFRVIYAIIGIVGVVDNLFVIVIFVLFIKITVKVFHKVYMFAIKTCRKPHDNRL